MRIAARIVEQFLGQWPNTPICGLILLLRLHTGELLQKEGVAASWVAQCARCVMGVEEPDNVETKISLKPYHIHVSTVHDFDDCRVCKHLIKGLQLPPPWHERVDDPVAITCADLHEADDSDVRTLVVVFQINGDFLGLLQLLQHLIKSFFSVNESRSRGFEGVVVRRFGVRVYGGRVVVLFDLELVRVRESVRNMSVYK